MKKTLLLGFVVIFLGFTYINNVHAYRENTTEHNWYIKYTTDHTASLPPMESNSFLNKYPCYYVGNTKEKFLYLTFDEGYENGYTSQILDILKKHGAKAAFFVVRTYVRDNPALVRRMVNEGHIVCNHSSNHPSMASIMDKSKFTKEFTDVENIFTQVTGQQLHKYFRPPMGKYSELSLKYTMELGYKTIFWSLAYKDWDIHNQPDLSRSTQKLLGRTHNGAIILLHTVSQTNSKILDILLSSWQRDGYEIRPLTDI